MPCVDRAGRHAPAQDERRPREVRPFGDNMSRVEVWRHLPRVSTAAFVVNRDQVERGKGSEGCRRRSHDQ